MEFIDGTLVVPPFKSNSKPLIYLRSDNNIIYHAIHKARESENTTSVDLIELDRTNQIKSVPVKLAISTVNLLSSSNNVFWFVINKEQKVAI